MDQKFAYKDVKIIECCIFFLLWVFCLYSRKPNLGLRFQLNIFFSFFYLSVLLEEVEGLGKLDLNNIHSKTFNDIKICRQSLEERYNS